MNDLNTVEGLSREVVRLEAICRRLTEENSVTLEALEGLLLLITSLSAIGGERVAQFLVGRDSVRKAEAAIRLVKSERP